MITRGPYSRTATRRAHPRKISKLPDPPAQQVERQAEPGVQPACFRFALTGNRQELEVPAAGSALQCADYGARIVVGPGDIHRLAVLTEGDGAWAGPRTEMLLGGGEVRVRVKAQTARVLDGTEHQQYSLENQSMAIQTYAESHSFEVVRTYSDAARSGLIDRKSTRLNSSHL